MSVLASPPVRPTLEVTAVRVDATRAVLQAYGVLDVAAAERLSTVALILTGVGPQLAQLLRRTDLDRTLLVADAY